MRARDTWLLFAVALVACSSAPVDRPLTEPATWAIDATPLLDIGTNPLDTLAPIGLAVATYRVSDGEIVVADRGYQELRFFDRDGHLTRTASGPGEGPGEVRYLGRMYRCGDSLVVHEMQRREMLVFDRAGGFGRGFRLTGPTPRFVDSYKLACSTDMRFLGNGWDTVRVLEPQRVRGTVPYWISGRDGEVERVLGSWMGSERLSRRNGSGPHPLGKEPVLAAGRSRFYLGTADSFAIEVFGMDGSALPPILKPSVVLTTSAEDIARFRLLDTLGKEPDEIARSLREWETFEFPPTVPAYDAMLVDRDDNLWVRSYPRDLDPTVRWIVFDPEGTEIGSIDLPVTLELFDIGSDWLLGIETRLSDGGQQVRMYRLHRAG